MNLFERNEAALANAAKNKSSEQMVFVLSSEDKTRIQVDNPSFMKVNNPGETKKIISDCGSSVAEPLDIYMAWIDRECIRLEERMERRMERMVDEKMVEVMEMIKLAREGKLIEERRCNSSKYQGRKHKETKKMISKYCSQNIVPGICTDHCLH